MFNFDHIVEKEFVKLRDEILRAYERSGKKVSGEFEDGLEVVPVAKGWALYGYGYLAGRLAGKMPPIKKILDWVNTRGIVPYVEGITVTQLAWAIAKQIQKQGTLPENHFKIYETVITPQRIQEILDRVKVININAFVEAVTIELTLLTKDI